MHAVKVVLSLQLQNCNQHLHYDFKSVLFIMFKWNTTMVKATACLFDTICKKGNVFKQ